MKVIWKYHYVPEGQLEPDHLNRWRIDGFIQVKKKAMPAYKNCGFNYILVPVAFICQKGTIIGSVPSLIHRFACNLPYVYDANLGYSNAFLFSNDIEDLKKQVEEKLNETLKIFSSAK